ncbi:hypothetical protein CLAFUW4_13915 [Fulvia fulva]|uniref:Uncharacterized protein n=1 Tax=Passalora fulva TaxID=5499 RepID=A0A9Q8UVX7_PASFU|nr:uncharacterized protein CLAFUR5_13757 [Fulvia fulva]KAK4610115.1 hypothetical protein CLAFUR4_13918 [Fulvia fulva]KAK4611182.1 hypothetical protein CLAFUR0_13922 [Fulvia fulva]UJO24428.1 hypothetical protein CLAFUR5_13757 [Fulvia fulva]WPV22299.1 hypothetical protein CLAFUW4_13915 [Fulvia fulva]WPV36802.1 hypothetical protein CLAFUW7_13923 [Fulvia fulva]
MTSKYKQKCIREGLRLRKTADKATYPPAFPFPLRRLVTELRLQIFEYIIANGWNISRLDEVPTLREQAVLRTCPQIRSEAMEAWRDSLKARKEELPGGCLITGGPYTWEEVKAGVPGKHLFVFPQTMQNVVGARTSASEVL